MASRCFVVNDKRTYPEINDRLLLLLQFEQGIINHTKNPLTPKLQ